MFEFVFALFLLLTIELLYFKIADHFNIIDKPNSRSSHTQITLRGGAIIFPIAVIFGILFWQFSIYYVALAVLLIALISFLDDIITLNNKLRILFHITSVALIIFQIWEGLSPSQIVSINPHIYILVPILFIFTIGIINAYNFMDGINGITVLYSIVTFLSIWMIQLNLELNLLHFKIWITLLAALIVFGFFNLRKKARTFAGDVGSISIALLICYLLIEIILVREEIKWILFLGIYGLDTVATIICRIKRKENIFDAHRSHFYQFLANEKKWNHVNIALYYGFMQMLLNLIIIFSPAIYSIFVFIVIVALYIFLRLKLEGKERLFQNYYLN